MGKSHEIIQFENGSYSIRDPLTGETMHSSIGPWTEAQEIYIRQTPWSTLESIHRPWVLWDVGLGLGANALAWWEHMLRYYPSRSCEVVSFEIDCSPLQSVIEDRNRLELFSYLRSHRPLIESLLEKGAVTSKNMSWTLIKGDFETAIDQPLPKPDILYYDFFSPASVPNLWSAHLFQKIGQLTYTETTLITYAASSSLRKNLIASGAAVTRGLGTLKKRETTLARWR